MKQTCKAVARYGAMYMDITPPRVGAMAPATVLVVDDDQLVREPIADYLREVGYEVLEAGDAHEAIDLVDGSGHVDLVFTDVPGRVAKALLDLSAKFGVPEDGNTRVRHDLTQEELAQLVGASRETVNKALSDCAHRGWLQINGRSVLLFEPERLARRAH